MDKIEGKKIKDRFKVHDSWNSSHLNFLFKYKNTSFFLLDLSRLKKKKKKKILLSILSWTRHGINILRIPVSLETTRCLDFYENPIRLLLLSVLYLFSDLGKDKAAILSVISTPVHLVKWNSPGTIQPSGVWGKG